MFTGNPFIKVVFNLGSESVNRKKEINMRTYNSQHKGNGRQQKHFILKKLRVDHAIIFSASEPSLVDECLDNRCKKYPHFLLRVLLQQGQVLYKTERKREYAL